MTNEEAYRALNADNRAMADQVIKALNYAQSNTQANTTRANEREGKKERKEEK